MSSLYNDEYPLQLKQRQQTEGYLRTFLSTGRPNGNRTELCRHMSAVTEVRHEPKYSGIERIVLLDFIHRLVSQKIEE
jgi:hypothetical protein